MRSSVRVVRRIPPLAVDVAVTLAVLAAHSAPFLLTARAADPVTGYTVQHYLPVLGQVLPLIWRRRAPLAVLVAVTAATGAYLLNDPDTAPQPVPYALLIAVYTVACTARGARGPGRWFSSPPAPPPSSPGWSCARRVRTRRCAGW
ncbi:DUF7134 domain-containing protein [Planomonospora algeriensis]